MTTQQITDVANAADVIIDGYAITADAGKLRVINLHHPESSAVFDMEGRMLETSMDDVELSIAAKHAKDALKYLEA